MTITTTTDAVSFTDLGLPKNICGTLSQLGYETPSPIQRETIPLLLDGNDVIGMAQTGTGKTAAFALPILAHIDPKTSGVQALVLCPTRELAIQVADALKRYATEMSRFNVLAIYGGQEMGVQLRALRRGVQVVVGTPGRVLDHLRRGSLKLNNISTLVLDEADEMLRMGFIDDVETVLRQAPDERQVALFSATMPPEIRKVAERYLNKPKEVKVSAVASTNDNIEQQYWLVSGATKVEALTRLLEVEKYDGMLIFVRTKNATVELADALSSRGFSAAALNGDMNQAHRVTTVEQLRRNKLDIVVATDVAARGLDVERISHVLNYDIPHDEEAYVHRIGRTGRAGRSGKAILFVLPRERRMLRSIERTTRKPIERIDLPSEKDVAQRRCDQFKEQVSKVLTGSQSLEFFEHLVAQIADESGRTSAEVAAALSYLQQCERPLQVVPKPVVAPRARAPRDAAAPRNDRDRGDRSAGAARNNRRQATEEDAVARPLRDYPEMPMQRYRLSVGRVDGVTPREIVGAIANEAGIEGRYIGQIKLFESYSTVDLPDGMPKDVFSTLKSTRVRQRPLNIRVYRDAQVRNNAVSASNVDASVST